MELAESYMEEKKFVKIEQEVDFESTQETLEPVIQRSSAVSTFNGCMVGEHLMNPSEINGMPYFPSGTTCLLSKCLTQEVWNQCKDLKDKHGYSFKKAIFRGSKWTYLGVGAMAGSHDSYYTFAPLFDKIIEQYHGHKPNDKHISSMDYTKLDCPAFSEEDDRMIKSTRIRVARNLD